MCAHASQKHGKDFTEENPWRDEETLIELYHGKGMSTLEIGKELGCASTTVVKWMDRLDIESRSLSEVWEITEHPHKNGRYNTPDELLDESWLYQQYHEKEKSAAEISRMLDCTDHTVRRWLDKHGIEKRSLKEVNRAKHTPDELLDESWLRKQYVEDELTVIEIAEKLGCSQAPVSRWVREYGIEHRNIRSGKDHPHYNENKDEVSYGPGWMDIAAQVRERDNHSCQRCGMENSEHIEKYGNGLTVHHIKPLKQFKEGEEIDYSEANDTSNLITLCYICHDKLEGMPIDNRAFA